MTSRTSLNKSRTVKVTPPGGQLVTKKQVRDMIRSSSHSTELKFKDFNVILTNLVAITFNDVTAVTQGVGVNQRVGDALTLRKFEGRLLAAYNLAPTSGRFVFFQWFPTAGPAVGDIFQTSTGVTSQFNGNKPDQFKILWDSGPFLLSTLYTEAFPGKNNGYFSVTKFGQPTIEFDIGASTGAGKIYMASMAELVGAAALYTAQLRVWFTDA